MIRSKLIRALLGVAVIGLILVMLNAWWGEYRTASKAGTSTEATSSPVPNTGVTPVKMLVLTDGLNLREKPAVTAKSIRGLKKDETLVVVSTSGSWVEVRDSAGASGWVTNNSQYLKSLK